MPRVIKTTVYKFDELSDQAKEKAREWWRDCENQDSDGSTTYDDAVQCGTILGIEIASRNQKCVLTGGKPREWISPAIYYSGFWSQGDGACFEGNYSYAKGASKKIREHAPQDLELHRIADELQKIQVQNFYRLVATMKHRGHYYHSGCMEVCVDGNEARTKTWAACEETVTQLMRDFADWIYKQLEAEYNWSTADEQVDESIRINEYEFLESGERA